MALTPGKVVFVGLEVGLSAPLVFEVLVLAPNVDEVVPVAVGVAVVVVDGKRPATMGVSRGSKKKCEIAFNAT